MTGRARTARPPGRTGSARTRLATTAALLVALAAPGCGDSDAADESAYTPYPGDSGKLVHREQLYERYRAMRQDLRAGRAKAVCDAFGTSVFAFHYFKAFGPEERLAECRRKVSRVLRDVEAGKVDWPPRRVRNVVTFTEFGNLFGEITTVRVAGGDPMALRFAKHDGRWFPEFVVPRQLEALDAK